MKPNSEEGFTLLELILALVLTGLLAAMAGMGVVSGFNVFIAARDNVHITQKANLALTRLTRELREITEIETVDAGTPYLIYDHPLGRRAVAKDGQTVKFYALAPGTTTLSSSTITNSGDILIDRVAGFTLNYFNGSTAWSAAVPDPIRELSAISFQLDIGRNSSGGRTSTFQNTVHLRNNNNYGGASPLVLPPTPPTQSDYCFISTLTGDRGFGSEYAIFVVLLMAILLFHALAWRRKNGLRPRIVPNTDASGAALVGIIVVLVVFSALAVVMMPMITASQYTQLDQDTTSKTYYLAESGYRYAASQYLNAPSEAAKNTALENLHDQTFTLAGNAGSFEVEIFPYYGYVQTNPGGTSTLTVRVPGGLSDDLSTAVSAGAGRLQIGTSTFSYASATTSASDLNFTMTAAMPDIPVDTDVFFLARTSAAGQTVNQGDAIDMASGSTRAFPLQNAEVVIDGNVYAYRTNDRTNDQLIGITDPEDPTMPALTLAANTDVRLSKFVDLQSTGSYGSGRLASQRLLSYHVPLPNTEDSLHRLEFHDTFDDLSHWSSIFGAQAVQEIDGNNAIRITDVDHWTANYPKISLAALDWTTTPIDLEWIHQRADNFLSYDAQVKIGFTRSGVEPPWGYTPPTGSIPTYFATGISFRLDDADASHNAYGLSFMRGNNNAPDPFDNLPNEIVPTDLTPIIVLWQQTNDGLAQTWLAYKQIGGLEIYTDDVENGLNGWTANGLWNINTRRSVSNDNSWYYGIDGTWSYDNSTINSGSLVSPAIDLDICEFDERLVLNFMSWHNTETQDPSNRDNKTVDIRTFNGSSWNAWIQLERIEGASSSGWQFHEIDLRTYLGERVQLRFHFDTVTADNNNFEGWYVDDIEISGNWPRIDSTLAVRLQEAPSLEFDTGGTYVIQPGDIISQNTASAEVAATPVVTSGSWASGDAAGHLILKNSIGSFATNQPFLVIGGGQAGTVRGVRNRDNFIRVYFSSASGCGTANSDPLDNERLANPRNPSELTWPVQDGDPYLPEDDTYTLIEWDVINPSVTSLVSLTSTHLRSSEADLLTPDGPLGQTRPELGLHALGHGATQAYFDDFGLSVSFDGPLDITSPVQE